MVDFPGALLSFAKLVGVLDESGVVTWQWFGNPLGNAYGSMAARREHLGALFRALQGDTSGQNQNFTNELVWVPLSLGGAPVKAGFMWNKDGTPLRLGFGAKADFLLGGKISLGVGSRMLSIAKTAGLNTEFGSIVFDGAFPVPDFLSLGSVHGEIPSPLEIALKVLDAESPADDRTLSLSSNALAWDCVRFAVFVLQAWVHKQASAPGENFFDRIDKHLFPMLGKPEGSIIKAFPLFDEMGKAPNFDAWRNSVLTTDNNAAGALTFLWHARALLTGKENLDFLGGSFYFPLVNVSGPITGNPPTLANQLSTPYKPGPNDTGAWVGITTPAAPDNIFALVLDMRKAGQVCPRIKLAQVKDGVFSRPPVPPGDWQSITNFLQNALQTGIDGTQITAEPDGSAWRLTLFNQNLSGTNVQGFDGLHKLQLFIQKDQKIAYRVKSPTLDLPLPPPTTLDEINEIVGSVISLVLNAFEPENSAKKVVQALALFIKDELTTSGSAKPQPLLESLVGTLANQLTIKAGPLTVKFTPDYGRIQPMLEVGPLSVGDIKDFHIGKLKAEADLELASGKLKTAKLSLLDFRLGEFPAGSDNLIGSLLPDFREIPGFELSVDLMTGTIDGGGKIPVQQSLGPVSIAALLVDMRQGSFTLGIDLSFDLGPIQISAKELGIQFYFKDDLPRKAGEIVPFLLGLGVKMDTSVFKLAGAFQNKGGDYVGGATVAVVGYFELSAIGGYTKIAGYSSLYIFASLVAPLGGPPCCFITGIAGGFGYNRLLPPPGKPIADHPFMQVMRGDPGKTLGSLSGEFVFAKGKNWVAAGIQFRSFGFIDGKLVVAAQFGREFVFQLLGLAAFSIKPLAYFEIGIEIQADSEGFKLKAGISPNSYLIHPDIFSLQGDLGLCVFWGGDHAGDFLLSIGGYHPLYSKPEHYPELSRVAVKAQLGIARLSIECFFAATPQALMAGASLSLSAEIGGIAFGLKVDLEVYAQWDPFHIEGLMAVHLWFNFLGHHEIGVELHIWTPPFGGKAIIDLALVSFEASFGATKLDYLPPPALHEFFTERLGVPATSWNTDGAKVATLNTADKAGLMRIDFLRGRNAKDEQPKTSEQEGITKPVLVAPEFAFAVRTRLPIDEFGESTESSPPPASLVGEVNLPLCLEFNRVSTLKVKATQLSNAANTIGKARSVRLVDVFPTATFGAEADIVVAQSENRSEVANVDSTKTTIPLTDGIEFHYEVTLPAGETIALNARSVEPSLPDEVYPLPLGPSTQPQKFRGPKEKIFFSSKQLVVSPGKKQAPSSRRAAALQQLLARKRAPLEVTTRTADLQRVANLAGGGFSTVASPPAGTAVAAVPGSPARRRELFGVNLRIVSPRAPVSLKRGRLETVTLARNFHFRRLTPPEGAPGPFDESLAIEAGKATLMDFSGGKSIRGTLAFSGQQTVRAIFLGGGERPVADMYVTGSKSIAVPPRVRRAVFIGEGMHPPVGALPGIVGATALESVGIEHDSVLLALGHHVFAGHGCLLEMSTPLGFAPQPLDSVPGFELLRAASHFRLYLPAARAGWSLALAVHPLKAEPGLAVEEIRWRSLDARLSGLHTVISPDRTAFLMAVETAGPWSLQVDLGRNWRLAGAALCDRAPAILGTTLVKQADWDMVDDRFQAPPSGTSTSVIMQITQ